MSTVKNTSIAQPEAISANQLADEFAAMRAEGRSLTEHPLASAVLTRQTEAGESEALQGIMAVGSRASDAEQAAAVLAAAVGLGLGYQAAKRIGGGKVFDYSVPGVSNPEMQGMVEGLSAPIKVAAVYSPIIPSSVMAGIAAQTNNAIEAADSAGGVIEQTTAASIEHQIAGAKEEVIAAEENRELNEAAKDAQAVAQQDMGLPVEGDAPKQSSLSMRSLLGLTKKPY